VFDASSALLSTIIGGGIVGVPYAMYISGIPIGLILNVVCWVLCYASVYLYMEAKKMTEVPVSTLYEFGYVGIGKSSIYFVAFLSTVQTVGFVMIYFIVFGDIMSSIVS
jgi:amino acid permease